MALLNIFDIAGSALTAQSQRLNVAASNMANADSVSSSVEKTYHARRPIFAAQLDQAMSDKQSSVGVEVKGIVESKAPLLKEYNPNHPMADDDGYIFKPNVNMVEEMADMINASRSYQTNVQVADSAKKMLQQTLNLGKS